MADEQQLPWVELTARELEVFKLIARGLSNAGIGVAIPGRGT